MPRCGLGVAGMSWLYPRKTISTPCFQLSQQKSNRERESSGLHSLLRSPLSPHYHPPPVRMISPGSFTKHKNCFRIFPGWLKFNEINQISEIFSSIFSDSRPHFRDFKIILSERRKGSIALHTFNNVWHCFCNLKTCRTIDEHKYHLKYLNRVSEVPVNQSLSASWQFCLSLVLAFTVEERRSEVRI